MKYDAVFFDLDGTVVDSLQDIADAVNHTMRRFGLAEWSPGQLKPHLGYGVGPLMRKILPADTSEARREEILAYYQPYYAAHSGDKSRPFEGILPMMARLKASGCAIAILSNKPDAATAEIAERFFCGLTEFAIGEKKGLRRKPWPDMVDAAVERLGLSKRECVLAGDSEVDIATAKNADVDCISVLWGFRNKDQLNEAGAAVFAKTPEELGELVLRS